MVAIELFAYKQQKHKGNKKEKKVEKKGEEAESFEGRICRMVEESGGTKCAKLVPKDLQFESDEDDDAVLTYPTCSAGCALCTHA